jgi:hypothetical protein
VIYIVKENRTYDQVLGDLGRGNGDPSLDAVRAASRRTNMRWRADFVTLDNFYDAGEVSGNGWPWSTDARETDVGVNTIPMQYADRGRATTSKAPIATSMSRFPTTAERRVADPTPDDPDLTCRAPPMSAAPDSTSGEGPRPSVGCGAALA